MLEIRVKYSEMSGDHVPAGMDDRQDSESGYA